MRILFDANVVLDDLLERQPFASVASELTAHVEEGQLDGVLCATTLTTIYYIASKSRTEPYARSRSYELVRLFDIALVDKRVLADAFRPDFADYEDAVLHEAAQRVNVDGIVTRDRRGFQNASLQIYAPDELAEYLIARDAG